MGLTGRTGFENTKKLGFPSTMSSQNSVLAMPSASLNLFIDIYVCYSAALRTALCDSHKVRVRVGHVDTFHAIKLVPDRIRVKYHIITDKEWSGDSGLGAHYIATVGGKTERLETHAGTITRLQ